MAKAREDIINDPIYMQFLTALEFVLGKPEWNRKKAVFAQESKISISYLTEITKKRRKAEFEKQVSIARTAGYTYEDFLDLGKNLLEGKAPKEIPPKESPTRREPRQEASIMPGGYATIPVFDAGAGEPKSFSDQGYPVGHASEWQVIDPEYVKLHPHAFAVKIHGMSMYPYLKPGDRVVVNPDAELHQGCLCFASWPGEFGDRLVKKYYREGDKVILRSINPEEPPIELNAENGHGVRIYRVTASIREE